MSKVRSRSFRSSVDLIQFGLQYQNALNLENEWTQTIINMQLERSKNLLNNQFVHLCHDLVIDGQLIGHMNKSNSVNDLTILAVESHLPFSEIMEGIDIGGQLKFKCQNKQGINLLSELAFARCERKNSKNFNIIPSHMSNFTQYDPCSFEIVNEFKEIQVIYAERLGTAKLTLVENLATCQVSFILPFLLFKK